MKHQQPAEVAALQDDNQQSAYNDLLAAYIRRTNQVLIAYEALGHIEAQTNPIRRAEIARAALLTMGPYSSEEQPA